MKYFISNKLVNLYSLIALTFLTACTVQTSRNTMQTTNSNFIKILGGEKGFNSDQAQMTKDIRISNLRIRQMKVMTDKCQGGYRYTLELDGEINVDTTYALEKIMGDTPRCVGVNNNEIIQNLLYLNSHGGTLYDGIKLGHIFRKNMTFFAVVIDDKQVCASACAIAFLGGASKHISTNGSLLFHAPYTKDEYGINCANKTEMDHLKRYVVEMLGFMGGPVVGERVFDRMMSVCSSSTGWIVNGDAAKIFKIIL